MDAESRQLEAALLDWIASVPAGFTAGGATRAERYGLGASDAEAVETGFEQLALALFAYQYERVATYRKYCDALDRSPSRVRSSAEVPALPVDAFKRSRVAAFPADAEVAAFHTSGTTQSETGILRLDSLALYHASLERGFRHHVLPDRDSIRMLSLVATAAEAPHSSLACMIERVRSRWGAAGSAVPLQGGEIVWRELRAALEAACGERESVCLLGTAFVWVQVLERCEREDFRVSLPAGSRLLETGGYKGRSRELSRAELYGGLERCFGIPSRMIVSEYGMTEMGSQLYSLDLRRSLLGEPPGDEAWSFPAWLRPRLLDPESNTAIECGAARTEGLVAQHDLANRGSVAHLLSADLGRPRGPSFELAGRCPRAELRGCGLVHENMAAR